MNPKSEEPVLVGEKYWIKVVLLCFFGWILIYGTRTVFNPLMGVMGEQFHLSNAQLGLANSIFFLTYTIFQIPFGSLGDRFGKKIVIGVGFLLLAICSYFTGVVTTFGMFLVVRGLAGISQAGYYGPQYALSTEAIPKNKLSFGNSLINSGMAFGTSGGYLLSSYLVLDKGYSWQVPFYIIAIPTAIVGILFFFLHEKIKTPEQVKEESEGKIEVGDVIEEAEGEEFKFSSIWKNKNLVLSFILVFCSIYANFVILTWLPQFLISERGFDGSSVGFISSLVPWASIPGALLFAHLSDKFGKTKILVYFLVSLAAVSTFGMAFVTNNTLLIISLILYGLTGKLALDPILVAYVSRQANRKGLGTTLSTYNFIGMAGSILAPYFTGWLADSIGSMKIGFYIGAIMLVIGLVAFSFAEENKVQ